MRSLNNSTKALVILFSVSLTLGNDNELFPSFQFSKSQYHGTIHENSIGNTYVNTDEKMGVYKGEVESEIIFSIAFGDTDNFFKAEAKEVGDFCFLFLRTKTGSFGVLNRERKDKFALKIIATARVRVNKKVVISRNVTVNIHVLDTNDLSPLFYSPVYHEIVPESMQIHSSILKVQAEDADLGINGEIYYSFLEKTKQFYIQLTSGVVVLSRPLNSSEIGRHELTVLAQDRGNILKNGTKISKAKLVINVVRGNLYSPEINVKYLTNVYQDSYTDIFAIISITDQDKGVNGEIKDIEILQGNTPEYFKIKRVSDDKRGENEFNLVVLKPVGKENFPLIRNLTIRVVDKGKPPRDSKISIPVHLTHVDDSQPVFNKEVYEVGLLENSPINTPIIRLKLSNSNQSCKCQVHLEIVGGNEAGHFYINAESGMLYTATTLDAEDKSFYVLTVSAIDLGKSRTRKQSSAKVKINLIDTNDNDPIFENLVISVSMKENEPIKTIVTKVQAKDKDSGENSYISYSIANLNPMSFEIDHFSGTVRTTQVLDYETMKRQCILHIRASDWGVPYRRQTEMLLKVKLRDVNDNKPQFYRVNCTGTVSRSLPIGGEIITVTAIDYDAGNIISYRLAPDNDNCFDIDVVSGEITVSCNLELFPNSDVYLNVTATDGTHLSDTNTIHVKFVNNQKYLNFKISDSDDNFICKDTGAAKGLKEILSLSDKNNAGSIFDHDDFVMMPIRYGENIHTPQFIDFPKKVFINETALLGSTVVKIHAKDRDLGFNGKLIYSISSGDQDSLFRMDPDSGEIRLVGYLDYEQNTEYYLNITVYDEGKPQKSTFDLIEIAIININDNAPKFQQPVVSITIPENVEVGTHIFQAFATDLDSTELVYSLMSYTEFFYIDEESGLISVQISPDREQNDFFELVVRCTDENDNQNHNLYTDSIVNIIVQDENDNLPKFPHEIIHIISREDIPIGTVVTVIEALDKDLGDSGLVSYMLHGELDIVDHFEIDSLTGFIRTTRKLDYEERQSYTLRVIAQDHGSPPLSSNCVLVIGVTDVNENMFAPHFEESVVLVSVRENEPIGTVVTSVKAVDSDNSGDDSRVRYAICNGDGLGYFSIDDKGVIRTTAVLDFETHTHFWLTVFAHDHGVEPLSNRLEVYVSVINANDNVPLTDRPVYYPHIEENSPPNSPVIQLTAHDADNEPTQNYTYTISAGNVDNYFFIDAISGTIYTTRNKLDREQVEEHDLEITVIDNGMPPLSSSSRVVVIVDDVNDHAPQFEQSFYQLSVLETHDQKFPVAQVLAVDKDANSNGEVEYSIKSGRGKGKFNIHPQTGKIFAHRSFNPGQEFDLLIRASDHGSPNKTATARVSLQFVSAPSSSKYPPTVKQSNQKVKVTEMDTVGFLVALIQATDDDGDFLWYSIVDGDTRSEFAMGGDAGSVLLAKQLDWETQHDYNLTVKVTDGIYSMYTQLYVNVVDINEHRPCFLQTNFILNISENQLVGSNLIQLNASDVDQDNKLVFSFHGSQNPISLSQFDIVHESGLITLAQPLDRESISYHVLILMVKDQGTPAKRNFAELSIHVHDANDHPPEWNVDVMQVRVLETTIVGAAITTVKASDKDHGSNAVITYSIVSGNIGHTFQLDPQLGTLTLVHELDMAKMAEYILIIKATDGGIPTLDSSLPVHVMVVTVDSVQPRFIQDEFYGRLFENEPAGTIVKHIEAKSSSSLHFEIISGNHGDSFTINPTTGIVSTKRPLDYEEIKLYTLVISTTNLAGSKAKCQLFIHILDCNDNAPVILGKQFNGTVSEDAVPSTLVLDEFNIPLVIQTYDADYQLNALLMYEILETEFQKVFHIDSFTGTITTQIRLDYEQMHSIEFSVRVRDLGKPQLWSSSTARVHVDIRDTNDCMPYFIQSDFNVTVFLPAHKSVQVVQVIAKDEDSPVLTSLQYTILSGNQHNLFSIDTETGIITVKNKINSFNTSPYRLKVAVSDGRFSSQAYVNIEWSRSSDAGISFQQNHYEGTVLENSTKPLPMVVVNVVGSKLNEHIIFSILNPSPLFQISKTSGAITTTGEPFDREAEDHYQLIIQALSEEYGGAVRAAHVLVNITVLDINDNCPFFINQPYFAVTTIDAQKGDVIIKVHAVDADLNDNAEVRYEFVRGYGELFRVDRKSGEVSLKQRLTVHDTNYQLSIAAYDRGSTPCSTEVDVRVKVLDHAMPVFEKQFYRVTIQEDFEIHLPLPLSISAESAYGQPLIYSITSEKSNKPFSIDVRTGILHLIDELDYETTFKYDLTVRATDSISKDFSEVFVNILVSDINDNAPKFVNSIYNITISERTPVGTVILNVQAFDNDTGINGKIYFSIVRNIEDKVELFNIDSENGGVYLKHSLDYEVSSHHHFLINATDSGVPQLSGTARVWINVKDVNDNPPKFKTSIYKTRLSEDAKQGHIVGQIRAIDKDQGILRYSIIEGNELHTFTINNETGVIHLTNLYGLLGLETHVINVSVSDGIYMDFCKVIIEMVPVNHHSPVMEKSQYDITIYENMPTGTLLIEVKATDEDIGIYGKILYSVPSLLLLESFHIDSISGKIWTKHPLDRETQSLYEIPVIAMDGGGLSDFSTVRITLKDVNDNPPEFLLSEYSASLYPNYTINSSFLKIKARDQDEGKAAQITFSIYEEQSVKTKQLFDINPHTGTLVLLKSVLLYENQAFQFFVRAVDNGIPPLHADVPVTVFIMSRVGMPPVFQRRDERLFISEDTELGSLITKVNLVTEMNIKYQLIGGASTFSINFEGEIHLVGLLDREVIPSYNLGVRASTRSSPALSTITEIFIQLIDVNDKIPFFHSDNYKIKVAENVKEGTSIIKVAAEDLDEGSNREVYYSIESDMFAVDANSGWISTLLHLDRETTPTYTLKLRAIDNGSPSHTSTALLQINIIDFNDNSPTFCDNMKSLAVSEDTEVGAVIHQFCVMDLDFEENSKLNFFIISDFDTSHFDLNDNGQLSVSHPLDREQQDSYDLTIVITDSKFLMSQDVHITILDVNDNKPTCVHAAYFHQISEDVPVGSNFTTVLASDLDLDSKLQYYLTGNGAQHFFIMQESGELQSMQVLDRELMPRYTLIAHVQDKEIPQWECTSMIEITVTDVNDNSPSFVLTNYTVFIPEDSPVGTIVEVMLAIDKDKGINSQIKYTILNSADDYFEIDTESGLVQLSKSLDREQQAKYLVTVQASDQGTPPLSTITTLQIIVTDINDNPPVFTSRFYHAVMSESAVVGSEVIQITAVSIDEGINAQVVYSISAGNDEGKFTIKPHSDRIIISQSLDFESTKSYLLTVLATDLGVQPLCNHATVNITVTDSNDNAPLFSQHLYSSEVNEHAHIGDVVLQVLALDKDSNQNGKISYRLIKGDSHKQFYVDSYSGQISVVKSLDREKISKYELLIDAKDSGQPQLSSTCSVIINIIDMNDNPPLYLHPNYTAIIQENKPVDWVVCQLAVMDADIFPNADPFIFEILYDDSGGMFAITSDGLLRTTSRLKQDLFTLQIRVYDNGDPPLYSDSWISVKVVEESQFPPIPLPLDILVISYQDQWPGGELGRITATDQDPYDSVVFGLATPLLSSLFEVDLRLGSILANNGLDAGKYHVNVSVSDGTFTSYIVVTVTVQALWDDMLHHSTSIRFSSITPKDFLQTESKNVLELLESVLLRNVTIIGVQVASEIKDLDVLLAISGDVELSTINEILESAGYRNVTLPCNCQNGARCRQRIFLDPLRMIVTTYNQASVVTPSYTHQLYCACSIGFAGDYCEELMPSAECICPESQVCVPHQSPPWFKCLSSTLQTACSGNMTCPPYITSSSTSISSEELFAICVGVLTVVFLVGVFIAYRRCQNGTHAQNHHDNQSHGIKCNLNKSQKFGNLDVTQISASYSTNSNHEIYKGIPLNNLESFESYGSAGDIIENMSSKYHRNINKNTPNSRHKIINELKIKPEIVTCIPSLIESSPLMCENYQDYKHQQTELITTVLEETIDVETGNQEQNPVKEETLDDEVSNKTATQREDDIISYGFPNHSQSNLSNILCGVHSTETVS